jgi:peptidyl-prolyl cis-trans isomerase D
MAVLSKIRQRSALMIAVIAFALFAFIIGDLFQSGVSTAHLRMSEASMGRIFHLRILELRLVMFEKKVVKVSLLQQQRVSLGIKRFQLLY